MDKNGLVEQPIERLYAFLMERIVRKYRSMAGETLRQHKAGLQVDEWVVLKQISEKDGCSQIELARSTLTGPAKMTRMIDNLVSKGLVEKHQSEEDRRRHMIFVSTKGKKLIEKLWPEVRSYRQVALQDFSEQDKESLMTMLQKMIHNLDK